MPPLFSLLYLALEGIAVLSAVHALFTVRTSQGTIAWIVGLVAFPILGLPLYWFFGSRRFESHSEAMRKKLVDHRCEIHRVRSEIRPFQVERARLSPARLADVAAIAGEEYLRGNRLRLLIDGADTFDAILAEIATARHCVFVQFYIMRVDGLGSRLLEALAAKAAEGVEVCFLFDSFGSSAMKPDVIQKWRDRGIKMATFCAVSGWRERWRLNFRNHRKNVIVDGRVGFVGGHNVGDEYLGLNPKYGPWRDTHVRVEGPAAMQLQMVFVADWSFATGELLQGRWPAEETGPADAGQRALALSSGPSDAHELCTLFFHQAIAMAEHRLWIASPYFVPDEGLVHALQLAAFRGVEVRILLPMKPDQWLVWLASFAILTELDHANIHIHRFTGGFLHQKALLVDDGFAAVGTANFDNRSFRLNFELTLAAADRPFASEIAAMFAKDFAASSEVDAREYDRRPLPFRAAARAARLLAPIL
jgi:cardiolipin synthase